MITPRKSRVLEKMRKGQKAISYKLNLGCPRAAEIAALSGFDAIWICQEHVPTDHSTMCNQILAARDNMIKNGFKEYTFHANHDCCDICAKLNGKHFPISRLKIGTNAPPMHDGCKCSISAYENDEEYKKWLNSL